MITEVRKPRAGAVRYKDTYSGGDYHIVEPGNYMYSTALMVAEEFWSEKDDQWMPINPPEEKHGA